MLKRKYRKDGTRLYLIKGNEANQCQDICRGGEFSNDSNGRKTTYFSSQTIGMGEISTIPLAFAF